jgi:hypothetical protein
MASKCKRDQVSSWIVAPAEDQDEEIIGIETEHKTHLGKMCSRVAQK